MTKKEIINYIGKNSLYELIIERVLSYEQLTCLFLEYDNFAYNNINCKELDKEFSKYLKKRSIKNNKEQIVDEPNFNEYYYFMDNDINVFLNIYIGEDTEKVAQYFRENFKKNMK